MKLQGWKAPKVTVGYTARPLGNKSTAAAVSEFKTPNRPRLCAEPNVFTYVASEPSPLSIVQVGKTSQPAILGMGGDVCTWAAIPDPCHSLQVMSAEWH